MVSKAYWQAPAEAACWRILLSLLVKAYDKAKLLPEEGRAYIPGVRGRWKVPGKNTEGCLRHRNAYSSVLYYHGNPAEPLYLLYWQDEFLANPLSVYLFQGKSFRRCLYALFSEKFFLSFRTKNQITHIANNSKVTGRTRRMRGFSGFLAVQTFNCQD